MISILVSIVSVYYNRENYVKESINSLLNQTYQDIEIILVDDGSTDNTLKKMREFDDSRIKIITHENQGFVKSIIKAIASSNGDFIAIHGSGDISYSNRIEKQVEFLKSNPDFGVVGCYVKLTDLVNNKTRVHKPTVNNSDLTNQLIESNIFTHGEVMFSKEIYEKVGGYNPFYKYGQDYDLWLRMSLLTNFNVVPEVLYERFNLPGGVSTSPEKRILQLYLGEISKQNIKLRVENKKDLLETHGIYAPIYLKKSKRLSRRLNKLATSLYLRGKKSFALQANLLSRKEGFYVGNLLLSIILKIPFIHRILPKIYNKIR